LIEIAVEGQSVAVFVGAPEDWSSYYVRMFAVSPRFQQRGLIRRFVRECVLAPLEQYGVERLVADTSPLNVPMLRLFAELKFQPTGHHLSERWGPLVRHTKFLDPSCESAFRARFSAGVPPA
jgi:RimJ/RimL family protein N-acetyltransferase